MKNKKLCSRCKKNKATILYANSITDFTHGFMENICQGCYDKQMMDDGWYQTGRREAFEEIEKKIKKIFYLKGLKFPMVSVDQVLELEQQIQKLKGGENQNGKQRQSKKINSKNKRRSRCNR